MKKAAERGVRSLVEYAATHALTGAQLRGPVWTGLKPRNLSAVATRVRDTEVQRANEAIEAKRYPRMGFMPDSGLGRVLTDRRVTRSTRRALLAVVQAPKTRRRAREERRVERRLTALGIRPL